MKIEAGDIDFEKGGGLVPAIVQDAKTLQVLMLAYMDRAAFNETCESGEATFFSRSRGGRWRKGETSGNFLSVVAITPDCDGDALLISVEPKGPACHRNTTSCFGDIDAPGVGRLGALERVIAARAGCSPGESWTARLMSGGVKRIAQKVGEEAVETALAAAAGDDAEFLNEAADLLFHLSVLLHAKGKSYDDVMGVLAARASGKKI